MSLYNLLASFYNPNPIIEPQGQDVPHQLHPQFYFQSHLHPTPDFNRNYKITLALDLNLNSSQDTELAPHPPHHQTPLHLPPLPPMHCSSGGLATSHPRASISSLQSPGLSVNVQPHILTMEKIHKTYLTFYTAISYEGMGLAAHNYSKNKLPLLQAAVEWFVACGGWVADADDALSPVQVGEGKGAMFEEGCRYSDEGTASEYETGDENENDTLERSIAQMIGSIDLHGRDPFEDDPFIDDEDTDRDDNAEGEWARIQGSDIASNSQSDTFQASLSPSPSLCDTDTDNETLSNSFTTTTTNSNKIYEAIEESLIPSPLNVRKASGESFEADILQKSGVNYDFDHGHVHVQQPFPQHKKVAPVGGSVQTLSLPLPVRVIPTTLHTHPQPHSGSPHYSEVIRQSHTQSQSATNHQKKTNTLHSLSTQITTSITTLQTHITYITALQHARHMSRGMRRSGSFWSFSPIKSPSRKDKDGGTAISIGESGGSEQTSPLPSTTLLNETKAQRIERLRGEGWRTVGIRSPRLGWKGEEYYRGFCEGVLEELYLGRSS
ncbi:uncharacterized protein BO80DRAFT_505464 [Aspergillus ibericus CBS 121593]|uniref:Uncharacterized protein n=1 Tax=Aspergillus ibericus CBS 121593 TaxID=1448316 RepID=A0A395GM38_9EURO|nr:hypothetical protein BO80DRAFT_505464 [Aspergillus ibericus CBS 121593]RAK96376.1 hypothetical protein BO80DRAFT_505464 [Aspergillus ibericus CBS 121593]